MGTDVPSFLVNDVSIPRLNDIPKTPGTGGYGPYPSMGRKTTRAGDESNASHDDSEQFFSASSPGDIGSAQNLSSAGGHSQSSSASSGKRPITGRARDNSTGSEHQSPFTSPTGSSGQASNQKAVTPLGNQSASQRSPKSKPPSNSSPPALPPKLGSAPKGIHTSLLSASTANSTSNTKGKNESTNKLNSTSGQINARTVPEGNDSENSNIVVSRNIRRKQTVRTPAATENSQEIPWDKEDPDEWTNERVLWWLEANNFSSQWTDKFKELGIGHERFFALVSYSAVKTLGILESPYRFVKLLRSVVPHAPPIQQTPSPIRVTPSNSPASRSPVSSAGAGSHMVYPQKLVTGGSGASGPISGTSTSSLGSVADKKDNAPTKINPFLAGSRRTSFEKYLFLDNKLRPRRGKPPGPSILVTRDGSHFILVSINDVENGHDVRKVVYQALFAVPPPSNINIRAYCELQLTDYFCSPGESLTDNQLWQILSAAAGDIVKFYVDAKPLMRLQLASASPYSSSDTLSGGTPLAGASASLTGSNSNSTTNLLPKNGSHVLTMPSRTFSEERATTPGWNVSSEEALSPLGPSGSQRFYPQTPSYMMGGDTGDYFNYSHSGHSGHGNHGNQRSSSGPGNNSSSNGPVAGPLFSGRSRQGSSVEQLVALRAAPKPPLARSLSSKYRPELSPVSSSPSFEKDSDGDVDGDNNDDMWADAPRLEDDTEDDSDSDSGLKFLNNNAPQSGQSASPSGSMNASRSTTPNRNPYTAGSEPSSASNIKNDKSSDTDHSKKSEASGSETSPTDDSNKSADKSWGRASNSKLSASKLPQLVIPRSAGRAAHSLMDHNTIEEESEEGSSSSPSTMQGLKPHGSGNKSNSNHKPTLSESSMDSPRSPGAAMLEQASIDWASRPPAEVLYENLERFFPNTDLDKPVVISGKNSAPIQSDGSLKSAATPALPPTAAPPVPEKMMNTNKAKNNVSGSATDDSSNHIKNSADSPDAELPSNEDDQPAAVSINRAKSIRVVAREASRRLTQRSHEPSSHLLRRRSTKMWGQRVVEMRKGTPNSVTLRDHKQYVWIKGELIGRGSFGKVYLGLNATTGDMMAVKQVKALRVTDPGTSVDESMKALYAEVENMKDLDHLNIVQYLGFQRLDRVSNLFLEYVPGGSVNSLLRNFGRFPDDTIRFLTRQVLAGLSYLHSRGILHRDLKADNLLLDIDGTIKISDFGISKRSRDIYTNNAEMSMQGTIFWMAPEVIHNVIKNQKQGYSAKVDVWSLGCVILEMYVGRRPWSTEEAIGAMYKLGSSKQAPPIPEDAKPHVSAEGKDFLDCCFVIDPKKRQTAHELLNHKFSEKDPNYKFASSKLAIDMNRSVKRTSKLLKTKQK